MRTVEFYRGHWGAVAFAIEANGGCPARIFIEDLLPADRMKLIALLKRAADNSPMNINNREKFKKLDDDLFEFKVFQIRTPCFFEGRTIVLTHGFKKKQDAIPSTEMDRAKRIRSECRAGVSSLNTAVKVAGKTVKTKKNKK